MPHRINVPLDRVVVEENPDADFRVSGRELLAYIEAAEELDEMRRAWPYDGVALEMFNFCPELAEEVRRAS